MKIRSFTRFLIYKTEEATAWWLHLRIKYTRINVCKRRRHSWHASSDFCKINLDRDFYSIALVTLALRIHKRPGHPGSPDVLSANRSLSTSSATLKLVSGGWSCLFAKSKFTSGPTLRVPTTTSWPSPTISLLTISPGPRRNVISPATVFNWGSRLIGAGSSYSASSSTSAIDLSCQIADLFNNR